MLASPRRIQDPARRHGYALAVALILLFSTAFRLWQLGTPAEVMFDEVYYAKDAKAIVDGRVGTEGQYRWAAGDEVSWPHPEMGKFAIATGILLLGDHSWGWRVPALVAGVVILACVYPLGRRLGLSPPWAVMALLFAAADPLGVAQSRIATLDVFIAMWTVICILLALRYVQDGWRTGWLFAAGLAGGMAIGTKWSGALAVLAAILIIVIAWLLQWQAERRDRRAGEEAQDEAPAGGRGRQSELAAAGAAGELLETDAGESCPPPPASLLGAEERTLLRAEAQRAAPPQGSAGRRVVFIILALVVAPIVVYLLSYTLYFFAGHTVADFIELHRQMIHFNFNLDATHTYASRAFTWIINYRPVWYYFEGTTTYYGVIAMGNPLLWWLATLSLVAAVALPLGRRSYVLLPAGALVVYGVIAIDNPYLWWAAAVSLLGAAVFALTRRSNALLPAAALVVLLYAPWLATNRTSFLYYMTPVAPFMAILVAGALCLFAGGVLPRRGWLVAGAAALATALLWRPIGIGAGWLFWTLPRGGGAMLGWIGVAVGVTLALAVVAFLLSARLRPYRPWITMVVAGLVIGIVVAFAPIVLGLPISPDYFMDVMWFPSWI